MGKKSKVEDLTEQETRIDSATPQSVTCNLYLPTLSTLVALEICSSEGASARLAVRANLAEQDKNVIQVLSVGTWLHELRADRSSEAECLDLFKSRSNHHHTRSNALSWLLEIPFRRRRCMDLLRKDRQRHHYILR